MSRFATQLTPEDERELLRQKQISNAYQYASLLTHQDIPDFGVETPYEPSSGWSAAGRSLLDAATFGFDDELLGYTGLGELFGLGSLEEMRARKKQLAAEHPLIYGGAQLAGYLLPMGVGAKLISKAGGSAAKHLIGGALGGMPAEAGLGSQIGYGALSGALHGLGSGEGLGGSIISTGVGGLLGGAVGGAVHGVLSAGTAAFNHIAGHFRPEEVARKKFISKAVEQRSIGKLEKLLKKSPDELDATQKSMAYADYLTHYVDSIEKIGHKSEIARDYIRESVDELPDRRKLFEDYVTSKLNLSPPELLTKVKKLPKTPLTMLFNTPNKEAVWHAPLLLTCTRQTMNELRPILYNDKLLTTKVRNKSNQELFDAIASDEGISLLRTKFEVEGIQAGVKTRTAPDTIEYWHHFKRYLTRKIDNKAQPLGDDIKAVYIQRRDAIANMLNQGSKEYKEATHIWSQYADTIDAIKAGKESFTYMNSVMTESPQTLMQTMEDFATGLPRIGFKVGFFDSLKKHIFDDVINNRTKVNEITWSSATTILGKQRAELLKDWTDMMNARQGLYHLKSVFGKESAELSKSIPISRYQIIDKLLNKFASNPEVDEELVKLSLSKIADKDVRELLAQEIQSLKNWRKWKHQISRVPAIGLTNLTRSGLFPQ